MTARIASANFFNSGLEHLQRRQSDLADAQQRLTSGKRVSVASDDPVAAARAERALVTISRSDSDLRSLEASRNAMTLTESAIGQTTDVLQRVRELMVSAGNATFNDGERRALAIELQGLREQLVSIASRTDENGNYLFFPEWAGPGGPLDPGDLESDPPVPVTYRGNVPPAESERMTAAREPLPLNVDGIAAWRIGAAPQQISDLFQGLDQAIVALRQTGPGAPQGVQIAQAGMASVDDSFDTLNELRARVGELLNRADFAEGRVRDLKLFAETERSSAEDLDMVQAVSDFQNRQTNYEAALKTYSVVQRMSLFDYIGR